MIRVAAYLKMSKIFDITYVIQTYDYVDGTTYEPTELSSLYYATSINNNLPP